MTSAFSRIFVQTSSTIFFVENKKNIEFFGTPLHIHTTNKFYPGFLFQITTIYINSYNANCPITQRTNYSSFCYVLLSPVINKLLTNRTMTMTKRKLCLEQSAAAKQRALSFGHSYCLSVDVDPEFSVRYSRSDVQCTVVMKMTVFAWVAPK